jgi:hypothetical protein
MFESIRKNLLFILIFAAPILYCGVVRAEDCEEARKWYLEGLALSDNSEREVSYYKKAIELCPNYFEAHNKLGEVYKRWGEYELAIKEFEQASRNPSFAEAHHNLGEIYRMQGRYDLAAEAFSRAIKMSPEFREAQNQLRYVEKRLGKYDAPIEEPPQLIPISVFSRIPGMTMPKGSFIVDFQYKYWPQEGGLEGQFVGGDPSFVAGSGMRDVDVHAFILGLRYGVTNNFTVGLIPMYFSRTANVSLPGIGIDAEPSVTGFGDTVFMTKYRLWAKRRTHISAYHLLSIPTGDEDATGEDEGVERRIPLGSGDYNFSPGIAFTTVIERLTMHANIWGIIAGDTTARQGGDEFRSDLALAFPATDSFTGILELNYRWQDSATRKVLYQTRLGAPSSVGPPWSPGTFGRITREATLKEEGGHTLFVSPGMQVFFGDTFKFELGVQIPAIRPEGTVEDFVVHAGLMKYFF